MNTYCESPEVFVESNKKINSNMTTVVSKLYQLAKKNEPINSDALNELVVDGFDNEQIWGQLQLFNDPILDNISKKVKSFLDQLHHISLPSSPKSTTDSLKRQQSDDDSNSDDLDQINLDDGVDISDFDDEDNYDDDENIEDEDENYDDENMDDMDMDDIDDMDDLEEEEEEEDEEEEEEKPVKSSKKAVLSGKVTKGGNVNFFNQREMEKFLDDEDEKGFKFNEDGEGDDIDELELGASDDEDGLGFPEADEMDEIDKKLENMLDNMTDENGKPVEKRKQKKSTPSNIMFSDFFSDPNEDGEEEEMDEFPLDDYQDDEDDYQDDDEEDDENDELLDDEDVDDEEMDNSKVEDEKEEDILPPEELSNFEKRAKRVQEKIAQLEAENLKKKEWTMTGETDARNRPMESLLSETLDFEHTQRIAPTITQETNLTLEDKIKKRIMEKNFDDVIRKTEKEFQENYKKKIELSDKKNTDGLSSVYEKDYMKKVMGVEDTIELKQKHAKLFEMYNKFNYKLDSMSNFQNTPKRIKNKELEITSSSAITMEEKIPVATSQATLIAPEEVYFKKNADQKGVSELNKEDRTKQRKQVKSQWKKDREEKEEKDKLREKTDAKFAKQNETKRAIKQLKESRNTTIVSGSDNTKQTSKYTKSRDFFKKLQDEQEINGNNKRPLQQKGREDSRKKSKFTSIQEHNSSKFKL
ncbi:U3 snoRNP protein [Tieghemostelium lacteum]|uniref:U3 small nucleolar ribonucleoprotein protein MPP10 n=1 Tax=Tieghemostelium lacteum TaxID=361077 RepID=A0A152A9D5_TIELA|nr:U3 snoRNP protein [Tieghemostelium lacteum]|eukprot:KYR02677.1 U3 snoRNP protein [Tieghemostelium lacteum]